MQLTLYYFPSCPFCQKVLGYLQEHNINVPKKDTHANSAYRDELIKIGGKPQVPCLVVDGKALYESDDIVEWFKENYK